MGICVVVKLMKEVGCGFIINILLIEGLVGMVVCYGYIVIKFVVWGLIKFIVFELGFSGI